MIISFFLYIALGFALYAGAGISVLKNPIGFLVIMCIVGLIDFVSMSRALGIL